MRAIPAQWWILVRRNFRVFFSDWQNLVLVAAQAPAVALLIVLAFWGYRADNRDDNHFARVVYYFHEYKAPYEADHAAIPIRGEVVPMAEDAAERETFRVSEPAARTRAAIYFVLISAAIWIGIMSACREVVNEYPVVVREAHSCMSLLAYVTAKSFVQAVLVAVQSAVLCLIVVSLLFEDTWWDGLSRLWIPVWLTAFTSACLGLLVSAASPTSRAALTVVPLLMMPQLLLGGLLRPPSEAESPNRLRMALSNVTIQKWGFQAALRTDKYAEGGVLCVRFSPRSGYARYRDMNLLSCETKSLSTMLFGRRGEAPRPLRELTEGFITPMNIPRVILGLMSVVCVALGYVALRWRCG
jgi:hypothetical protein